MEKPEDNLFYVTDPVEEKESFGKYISYLVKGAKIPEPLPRRFKEFDLLRTKLMERFPGLWIPPLPKKKFMGSNSSDVVNLRIDQINRFCKLISENPILYNSQEISSFLSNVAYIDKVLNSLPKERYPEFLTRYKNLFQIPPVNINKF